MLVIILFLFLICIFIVSSEFWFIELLNILSGRSFLAIWVTKHFPLNFKYILMEI